MNIYFFLLASWQLLSLKALLNAKTREERCKTSSMEDFSMQEIFHASHRFTCLKRSLVVVSSSPVLSAYRIHWSYGEILVLFLSSNFLLGFSFFSSLNNTSDTRSIAVDKCDACYHRCFRSSILFETSDTCLPMLTARPDIDLVANVFFVQLIAGIDDDDDDG